jgi:hypothetical protein
VNHRACDVTAAVRRLLGTPATRRCCIRNSLPVNHRGDCVLDYPPSSFPPESTNRQHVLFCRTIQTRRRTARRIPHGLRRLEGDAWTRCCEQGGAPHLRAAGYTAFSHSTAQSFVFANFVEAFGFMTSVALVYVHARGLGISAQARRVLTRMLAERRRWTTTQSGSTSTTASTSL